jgi:hypothetical protein
LLGNIIRLKKAGILAAFAVGGIGKLTHTCLHFRNNPKGRNRNQGKNIDYKLPAGGIVKRIIIARIFIRFVHHIENLFVSESDRSFDSLCG